jgi:hypothetical protein
MKQIIRSLSLIDLVWWLKVHLASEIASQVLKSIVQERLLGKLNPMAYLLKMLLFVIGVLMLITVSLIQMFFFYPAIFDLHPVSLNVRTGCWLLLHSLKCCFAWLMNSLRAYVLCCWILGHFESMHRVWSMMRSVINSVNSFESYDISYAWILIFYPNIEYRTVRNNLK